MDKIYFGNEDNCIFLDCTRLDGKDELVSRKKPNEKDSVNKQIKEIASIVRATGKIEIILVDDVVFSGNVLRNLINKFNLNGIKVIGIRSSISTKESYDYFNRSLEKGLKCGCLLGENVIDQICERDFYFGIAQSGISVLDNNGEVLKSPYFKPYGDSVKRASIPKKDEDYFSNGCLLRSIYLWKCIEENSKRKIYIKDLPEKIINTKEDERVIDILRKGLIYNEKDTNRNNGECR